MSVVERRAVVVILKRREKSPREVNRSCIT